MKKEVKPLWFHLFNNIEKGFNLPNFDFVEIESSLGND